MGEGLRFIFVRNDLLLNKNYLVFSLFVGDKIRSILSVGFANEPYGESVANNVLKGMTEPYRVPLSTFAPPL